MINASKIPTDTGKLTSTITSKFIPIRSSTKPFLKWAGGKTQIVCTLLNYSPSSFNKYIEPFVGGGALFFNISPSNGIISDLNEELIITYQEVKRNVREIISILDTYKNEESFYYKIRKLNTSSLTRSERAARLIYLNKTCFNGLFRVNKRGEFNVPYGKRTGPFLDKQTLIIASEYLSNAEILHSDYKDILNKYASKGDFIFLDPPYQPVGKFSDFKRYTKEFFYENNQIELAGIFHELVKKGCYVILTNSDHPFIMDLYKGFQIEIIQTKRLISSNPNTRIGKDIVVLGGL
jgi:DNA adenine methylase